MTSPDDSSCDTYQAGGVLRVLVIDDEPDLLDLLSAILRREGFSVRTAASGQSGLDALKQEAAEVLITDIIMPRKSGIDVIAEVRALYPSTRVIAISGGGNFGPFDYQKESITTCAYLAASERQGAHAVLAKPFDARELIAVIRHVVGH
jgi:DNA-binding response OmpR family regulator